MYFPEWADREDNNSFFENFKLSFMNGRINFLWKDKYGVEMHVDSIPSWLPSKGVSVGDVSLNDFYKRITEEAHSAFLAEAESAFEIFESWREKGLIQRYVNNEWRGHIQNNIQFKKSHGDVEMFDYYHPGEDSPVKKLSEIEDIPSNFLNKKYLKYQKLSSVIRGGSINRCGSINGKNFYDCVKNADKVYSLASVL